MFPDEGTIDSKGWLSLLTDTQIERAFVTNEVPFGEKRLGCDVAGGKLEKDDDFYQLAQIKYKVADSSGKIKIMSKPEMLRNGVDSPDVADALSMTFARTQAVPAYQEQQEEIIEEEINDDPYDSI